MFLRLFLLLLLGLTPSLTTFGAPTSRSRSPRRATTPTVRSAPANRPAPRPASRPAPATPPASTAATGLVLPLSEITLERRAGDEGGAAYRITLRRDGTAAYTGIANAERMGSYRGTVSRTDFARLSMLLTRLDFFNRRNRYTPVDDIPAEPGEPQDPWGALPTTLTSALRGGTRKTVTNEGDSAPMELWTIERAIQGVASEIPWTPGRPLNPTRPNSDLESIIESDVADLPARPLGDGTSGIRGTLLSGPVTTEGEGEAPRPMPDTLILVRSASTGRELTRTRTDELGNFEVSLPPGKYLFTVYDRRSPRRRSVSIPTSVRKGRWEDMVMEYIVGQERETVIGDPNAGINEEESSDLEERSIRAPAR